MSGKRSLWRQELGRLAKQYDLQLDRVLHERRPLIRGTFGTRRRKCGKPNCHCVQGELHESKYVTATDGGRVRQIHVPDADEVKVEDGTYRYKRFLEARKTLGRLAKRQLELVDLLGDALLDPYPPDAPLPAAKKRGRKPGKRSGDSG